MRKLTYRALHKNKIVYLDAHSYGALITGSSGEGLNQLQKDIMFIETYGSPSIIRKNEFGFVKNMFLKWTKLL